LFLVFARGACALRSLPYLANWVPMAESITTVKNQRHGVRFLNKIKPKTDILSVLGLIPIVFNQFTCCLSADSQSVQLSLLIVRMPYLWL
jgi:hypothetical protein